MAADNLILKAGTWHARYVIPEDLREYFGKSQFSQSLKTGSKAEAQNLKVPLTERPCTGDGLLRLGTLGQGIAGHSFKLHRGLFNVHVE